MRSYKDCIDCGVKLKHYRSMRCRTCEAKRKHKTIWEGRVGYYKGKKRPEISGSNHHFYGKHHTQSTKDKISRTKGKSTYLSINGLSKLRRLISFRKKYSWWRKAIIERYSGCDICKRKDNLFVHHKVPVAHILELYEIKSVGAALECRFLFDVNNGIVLCEDCHHEAHR